MGLFWPALSGEPTVRPLQYNGEAPQHYEPTTSQGIMHSSKYAIGTMIKRLMRFEALLVAFLLPGVLGVQAQSLHLGKQKDQNSLDRDWVIHTLITQTPIAYVTDGTGKFRTTDFAYMEVRFTADCKLQYLEERSDVNPESPTAERVHRLTPKTVSLTDFVGADPKIAKYSETNPAPAGFRYTAEPLVITIPGKPGDSFVFEGEQTARQFIATLAKTAQSCSASH